MGRSPCCDKVGLKKGPWTPEEDQKLLAYIEEHGHGSWRALPAKAGLQRCGKSCRLRWTNYLRPDIKRGKFSVQEEQTIIQLHALLGNRWSAIATHLPKRTDNEIKNYWNTHLKKRLTKMGIDPVTHKPKSNAFGPVQSKDAANLSHMAQWESARLEAEARLVRESKLLSSASFQPPQINSSSSSSSPPSSTSQPLLPKVPPPAPAPAPTPMVPPCLDVLRAWQGVWSKPTRDIASFFASTGAIESPTSTLNFSDQTSAFAVPNVGVGVGEIIKENVVVQNVDWKCVGTSTGKEDQIMGEFEYRNEEDHDRDQMAALEADPADAALIADSFRLPNFMDGLTDILLDNVEGHASSNAGGHADAVLGSCGGDFEENKNYWSSLLYLVNTSPSRSPVF